MSVIDDYIKHVDPTKQPELQRIRTIALAMLPGAKEIISYGMPTIQYKGKSVIGFDAHKNHIGIYPFSGHVIEHIAELAPYSKTKGAVQEKLDNVLPKALLQKIIKVRLQQAFAQEV